MDFSPLTAFAGDDPEAASHILETFLQETLRHAEAFSQACREKNKAEACRLAHKMLPTFSLIGAPCTASLQAMEQRRTEHEWTEADDTAAQDIDTSLGQVIRLLQSQDRRNKNI